MQPISDSTLPVEPTAPRPDTDIAENVALIIRNYPPLYVSHDYMQTEINDGQVTIRGNVGSSQAVRVLQNEVPRIAGVTGLDLEQLYEDEAVQLNVAEKLPEGLYVTIQFGEVALNGTPAADLDQPTLFATIKAIPGVRQVLDRLDAIADSTTLN